MKLSQAALSISITPDTFSTIFLSDGSLVMAKWNSSGQHFLARVEKIVITHGEDTTTGEGAAMVTTSVPPKVLLDLKFIDDGKVLKRRNVNTVHLIPTRGRPKQKKKKEIGGR